MMPTPDIVVIDSETTGLADHKKPSSDPSQPRVASLGALFCDGTTGRLIRGWYGLLKTDGWTMPPDMQALHGISGEDCDKYGFTGRQALASLISTIVSWPGGPLEWVGAFPQFDLKMLKIECERAGMRGDADAVLEPMKKTCVLQKSTKIIGLPPSPKMVAAGMVNHKKQPNLKEAMAFYFREAHEEGHNALSDCFAAWRVWMELRRRGVLAPLGAGAQPGRGPASPIEEIGQASAEVAPAAPTAPSDLDF